MNNASLWREGRIARTSARLILTIGIIIVFAGRGHCGSGLDAPEPIGPYLNGKLPSQTPQTGSWALVDAFPGLSFTNPLFLAPLPGTNDLVMIEQSGLGLRV